MIGERSRRPGERGRENGTIGGSSGGSTGTDNGERNDWTVIEGFPALMDMGLLDGHRHWRMQRRRGSGGGGGRNAKAGRRRERVGRMSICILETLAPPPHVFAHTLTRAPHRAAPVNPPQQPKISS